MRIFISFLLVLAVVIFSSLYGVDAAHQDLETKRSSLEQMVVEENNVYSIWRQQTGNDFEILFRASNDGGETFGNVISLTEIKDRVPDGFLTAKDNLVYAFLEGEVDNKPVIYFSKSIDGGNTFGESTRLIPNSSEIFSYRSSFVIDDEVFVFLILWHPENQQRDLVLVKGKISENSFSEPVTLFILEDIDGNEKLRIYNFDQRIFVSTSRSDGINIDVLLGELKPDNSIDFFKISEITRHDSVHYLPHVFVSESDVYAVWFDINHIRENDIFFVKSVDGGKTFSEKIKLNPVSDRITHIFSPNVASLVVQDDNVYVSWVEEEHAEEDQLFHYNLRQSNDGGITFSDIITPMEDPITLYHQVVPVSASDGLHYIWSDLVNEPLNDFQIYDTLVTQDKVTTKKVTESFEAIWEPQVSAYDKRIYIAGEPRASTQCILLVTWENSLISIKDVNPLGSENECIKNSISAKPSPQKQYDSDVPIHEIKCREDKEHGFILALKSNTEEPVCIFAKSYDKMVQRDIIAVDSFEKIALSAARDYVMSNPQISSKIVKNSLDLETSKIRDSIPPIVTITGVFDSSVPLYDDSKLTHNVELMVIQNNMIHFAKVDDTELTDTFVDPQNPSRGSVYSTPTVKNIISVGERLNSRGLVPVTITEVTQGNTDEITHWTFQSIGYHGDNRGQKWEILEQPFRLHEIVDKNGNDAIDRTKMPENYGIPLDLHGYTAICEKERVAGESGHPTNYPIKSGIDTVYARQSDRGIYPDSNGVYFTQFVSLFETKVEVPDNVKIILNETKLCPLEGPREDATHAYYTKLEFTIDDEWTESYYSPDSTVQTGQDDIHEHASVLVRIFGDKFEFSKPEFQLKAPKINFEPLEQDRIHRNSKDATLGFLFDSLNIGLTSDCFVISDGKKLCTDENHSLKFYINDEKLDNIRDYVISNNDKILISYGSESQKEIQIQLEDLESIAQYHYTGLEKLMKIDVGTVKEGTYNSDLGFQIAVKLMEIDMERQVEKQILEDTLAEKQDKYNKLVQESGDPLIQESLLDEIKQLESQLKDISDEDYTTEEIFERMNEIESENIKMYKIGPEEYEDYVAAKTAFEYTIEEKYWKGKSLEERKESFPLVSVQINPDNQKLEIVLHKDVQGNTSEIEQFESVISEIIPSDVPWTIIFSD